VFVDQREKVVPVTHDSIAPESDGPAIPAFWIALTPAELERSEPKVGTVLHDAKQRVLRERHAPRHTTGRFDNRI
jgi:hypothetical protein